MAKRIKSTVKRPVTIIAQTIAKEPEKIRVAAYCRVSTDNENQLNSYQTQISYYTELINSNPEWELVGIFADEGLSGTQLAHRTEMNKLLVLARKNKVDLILCKSISRFARNTVDLLDTVRELKSIGVGVKFEKENIDTMNVNSEFIISLYASFAQAESESISKNVLWGIQKRFSEGNVRYNLTNTLGYRMGEDGVPVIVEEEAEVVREIFSSFAEGISMMEIAKSLTDRHIPRRNGETTWHRGNVFSILKSEKYVGDAIMQKSYTVDCLTHQRAINYGEKPKYYVRDAHPAIVDRETYDRVRLELAKRSCDAGRRRKTKGKYRTKYILNDIMYCPFCGARYMRTIWQTGGRSIGVWRCGTRMRLDKDKCRKSPSIHEDKLHKAIIGAVNDVIADRNEIKTAAENKVEILTEKLKDIENGITDRNEKLGEIDRKRDEILSLVSGSGFEMFKEELKELKTQDAEYSSELERMSNEKMDTEREISSLKALARTSDKLEPLSDFDEAMIGKERPENNTDVVVAHYEITSPGLSDADHPSRRVDCADNSAEYPHNRLHLIIGDFYINTIDVLSSSDDGTEEMSSTNKEISVNLTARVKVVNQGTHAAIDDYLRNPDVTIYQSFLVLFNKYKDSASIGRGVSAIDDCSVSPGSYTIKRYNENDDAETTVKKNITISSINTDIKSGFIELQNNTDISSELKDVKQCLDILLLFGIFPVIIFGNVSTS